MGTLGAPLSIDPTLGFKTANTTYTPNSPDQIIFCQGLNTGNNDMTSLNPPIQAGTIVGQKLRLCGTSSTKYITLGGGFGILMPGTVILNEETSLKLWWNGSAWEQDT